MVAIAVAGAHVAGMAPTDDTDADGADPAVRALLTRLDLVRFLDTFRENEVDAASLPALPSMHTARGIARAWGATPHPASTAERAPRRE